MNLLSKVVWSEGMHLGAHHFQAQNRNLEDIIHFLGQSLWAYGWGFAGLSLDHDGIRNGTVSALHARGVFPDGLLFEFPASDPAPEPLAIQELFPPLESSLRIYLAGFARRERGVNCALDGANGTATRYIAAPMTVADENTGADERSIRVGRKNIRLVTQHQLEEGMTALALARVRRDGSGHFVYDSAFIPPCLTMDASDGLMQVAERTIALLEEKSAAVNPAASQGAAEVSTRQVASFWFAHAVNSALGPLRHLWLTKRGHPEELFLELARLAGALCTFGLDAHPSKLPLYDHDNLTESFEKLDLHIRRGLELIIPTNCLTFPLERTSPFIHEGELKDPRAFARAQWVLGVRSAAGDADVISLSPRIVKVCSARFIGDLVRRAMPGLGLTHIPVPPAAISRRIDTHYFAIKKTGPCWDTLLQTRAIGVYVPGDLPEAELELLTILDSES